MLTMTLLCAAFLVASVLCWFTFALAQERVREHGGGQYCVTETGAGSKLSAVSPGDGLCVRLALACGLGAKTLRVRP